MMHALFMFGLMMLGGVLYMVANSIPNPPSAHDLKANEIYREAKRQRDWENTWDEAHRENDNRDRRASFGPVRKRDAAQDEDAARLVAIAALPRE